MEELRAIIEEAWRSPGCYEVNRLGSFMDRAAKAILEAGYHVDVEEAEKVGD